MLVNRVRVRMWVVCVCWTVLVPASGQSQGLVACPDGMMGYWTFDQAATPAVDDHGTRDGTVRGATWSPAGQVGGALYFDANDDVYIGDVRPIAASATGGVTFTFWGKPDRVPHEATRVLVYKSAAWEDKPGDLWCRLTHYEGGLYVESVINRSPYVWEPHYVWSVPVAGSPDVFHHVACSYDADRLRVYFDGALVGDADVGDNRSDASNGNPLTFGSQHPRGPSPGIDNSRGYLDEVAVFSRALSADEIAGFHANGMSGRGYCSAAGPLASVRLADPLVSGCITTTGSVWLTERAPAGGLTVTLHSSNPNVVVPPSVKVYDGTFAKRFQIRTSPVAARETARIEASVSGQSLETVLTLRPMGAKSLTFAPNPVAGGATALATVTLQCPAGPGDVPVTLSSSQPEVASPSPGELLVPMGTQVVTFDVLTTPVTRVRYPAITAAAGETHRRRPLTVVPVP